MKGHKTNEYVRQKTLYKFVKLDIKKGCSSLGMPAKQEEKKKPSVWARDLMQCKIERGECID